MFHLPESYDLAAFRGAKELGLAVGYYYDRPLIAISNGKDTACCTAKEFKEIKTTVKRIYIWDSSRIIKQANLKTIFDISLLYYQFLNVKNPTFNDLLGKFNQPLISNQYENILKHVDNEMSVPYYISKNYLCSLAKASFRFGTEFKRKLSLKNYTFYWHLLNSKKTLLSLKKNKLQLNLNYYMQHIEKLEVHHQRTVNDIIKYSSYDKLEVEFNLLGTNTGRLSCKSKPNIHSLPNNIGIKRGIISSFKGGKILVADWNAMELRLALSIAGENIESTKDLHITTAKKLYNKANISKEEREKAKILNFAAIYGGPTSKHFGDISAIYPALGRTIESMTRDVSKARSYVNCFGRKRVFAVDENCTTKAFNNLVQGTAADISLRALNLLQTELEKQQLQSKILLTVHDSFVLDVESNELTVVTELIKNVMTEICIPAIYSNMEFPVNMYCGDNYEDLVRI
tara:strand:- start:1736 stop:3109 length:1374 start_codon:yes stop_codon:yes gene_type:complete